MPEPASISDNETPAGLPVFDAAHYRRIHDGIRRAFLNRGGTDEQWDRVNADSQKFNRAWNRLLGLPDSVMPPPAEYRNIDPSQRPENWSMP